MKFTKYGGNKILKNGADDVEGYALAGEVNIKILHINPNAHDVHIELSIKDGKGEKLIVGYKTLYRGDEVALTGCKILIPITVR